MARPTVPQDVNAAAIDSESIQVTWSASGTIPEGQGRYATINGGANSIVTVSRGGNQITVTAGDGIED